MKKYLSILSLLVTYSVSAEPVVDYDFNELKVIDRITGNALQSAPGEESGIEPGLYGNAVSIEPGKGSMVAASSPQLALSNDFTISCVFRPDSIDGYRAIVWKGDRKAKPELISYYLGIRDGKFEFKFKDAAGEWVVYSTSRLAQAGTWYHWSVYFKDGKCEFFINGEPIQLAYAPKTPPKSLIPNNCNVEFGCGANSRGRDFFFLGLLDDFKIYRGRYIDPKLADPVYQQALFADYRKRLAEQKEKEEIRRREEAKRIEQKYLQFFTTNQFGDLPGYVFVPTVSRIVRKPDFIFDAEKLKTTPELAAARGEYEGIQLVLLGHPQKDVEIKAITISELKNTNSGKVIPASAVTVGRIGDVESEKPDIPVPFVGKFPDPIFVGATAFSLPKQDFMPVFIKVNAGATPPGRYQGVITVDSSAGKLELPLSIRVYDFQLPEKGSLRTALCFFEQYYTKWYGKSELTLTERMKIYDFLLSYRFSPNNIYHTKAVYPGYDALAQIKGRTNFLTLSCWGGGKELLPESALAEKIEKYRQEIAKVQELGMTEDMYFYSYDEISHHEVNIPAAKQMSEAMKKAFPNLRMMQTSFPNENIRDLYNVWCPIFDQFTSAPKQDILNELKTRGDEIWWYAADAPGKPYPNFFLDYPVFDCRVIGLLSYKYQVTGFLYWSINREWETNLATKAQWEQTGAWKPYIFHAIHKTRKNKNGMGNFVYPGRNGELLPSLRLENFRDGLEDYEYVTLLKKLVKEMPADHPLRPEAEKLLTIPGDVAEAVNQYNQDPVALLQYRSTVADIIERINRKKP